MRPPRVNWLENWLKEEKVHIAGSHLQDPETSEYNLPFIRRQFPNRIWRW